MPFADVSTCSWFQHQWVSSYLSISSSEKQDQTIAFHCRRILQESWINVSRYRIPPGTQTCHSYPQQTRTGLHSTDNIQLCVSDMKAQQVGMTNAALEERISAGAQWPRRLPQSVTYTYSNYLCTYTHKHKDVYRLYRFRPHKRPSASDAQASHRDRNWKITRWYRAEARSEGESAENCEPVITHTHTHTQQRKW